MSTPDAKSTLDQGPMRPLRIQVVGLSLALNVFDGFDIPAIGFSAPAGGFGE